MITWDDLKVYVPQDILVALTDDLKTGVIDKCILDNFIAEAYNFLPAEVHKTQDAKLFVNYYVLTRLYERYGYLEQAKYYKEQANNLLKHLTSDGFANDYKQPYAISDGRYLTDDILEKW